MTEHATCVDLEPASPDGFAVLLRGPPGAGKSDLALRLIDGGALLVADDRVVLRPEGGAVWASPPDALAGLLEVRGLGICRVDWRPRARVGLVCDLVADDAVERLPAPARAALGTAGLPCWRVAPFQAGAPARIRLMAQAARRTILLA
jgi:HPr kinase/phosphorylase